MKVQEMRAADGTRLVRDSEGMHNMKGTLLRRNGLTIVQAKLWMIDTNVVAFFMQPKPGVISLVQLAQGPRERDALAKARPTVETLLG